MFIQENKKTKKIVSEYHSIQENKNENILKVMHLHSNAITSFTHFLLCIVICCLV